MSSFWVYIIISHSDIPFRTVVPVHVTNDTCLISTSTRVCVTPAMYGGPDGWILPYRTAAAVPQWRPSEGESTCNSDSWLCTSVVTQVACCLILVNLDLKNV